jgi:hypothetical protein
MDGLEHGLHGTQVEAPQGIAGDHMQIVFGAIVICILLPALVAILTSSSMACREGDVVDKGGGLGRMNETLLEKRPTRRSHYFRSAHVTYIVYS